MTNLSVEPEDVKTNIVKKLDTIRNLAEHTNDNNVLEKLQRKLTSVSKELKVFSNISKFQQSKNTVTYIRLTPKTEEEIKYGKDESELIKDFIVQWNHPKNQETFSAIQRSLIYKNNDGKVVGLLIHCHPIKYYNIVDETYKEYKNVYCFLDELRLYNEKCFSYDEEFSIDELFSDGRRLESRYSHEI